MVLKQNSRLFVSVEIDKKIERYRNILRSIRDEATVDGAEKLIADLEAQKAALHPERSP
jgi:hypothetical protein